MPNQADVLILGGGVIGLTTAYYLATRDSARVAVLDRGALGREASWAGAGIIPSGRPVDTGNPIDWLHAISGSMIAELSVELREAVGIQNGYRRTGGIELPGDEAMDTDAWTRRGVDWEKVNNDQMREIEPAFAPNIGPAYFLPQMAQIRNPRHLQALIAATTANGVELCPGCLVGGFDRNGRRITAALTSDGRRIADQYLVCAGAWTDSLLSQLGCQIGARPIRGQIVLVHSPASILRRILLAGKRYLVPRDDGRVLVGSTEEDAGFDKSTTAEAVGALLQFAMSLVPALARAEVENCWAGLRPGSPDGLPTLGRVPGFDNLWVAAGHYRAGLQLSAVTGLLLAEALTGQPPRISLDAFRPDRPSLAVAHTAFRF